METGNTTLYVGNLDPSVNEDLIGALFSQMGSVKSCKVIRDSGSDPYAFVEYHLHNAASTALIAMNKRVFLEREMKVNWATSSAGTGQPKTDTSHHHHIFVGDLSPEIDNDMLREAFAPFGEISNCRIVRDPQTLKSKGYAFVSFVKKGDAENAIQSMNGQWIGSRAIRTNWSTRKPPTNLGKGKTADYDEIYNKTSPTNTTVYCGGFAANVLTEDMIYKHFGNFGQINDIRVFKDKGYAFIKFMTKESAARAIESTNNSDVYGHTVKCFWGKENGNVDSASATVMVQGQGIIAAPPSVNATQQQLQQQQIYAYQQQQMAYWYPAGYPQQMTAQAAQYMQQYSGYQFAYASPQQQNAGYRMIQPTAVPAGWGVPPPPPASLSNGQSNPNSNGTPQPQMLYTMQQFQTQ